MVRALLLTVTASQQYFICQSGVSHVTSASFVCYGYTCLETFPPPVAAMIPTFTYQILYKNLSYTGLG